MAEKIALDEKVKLTQSTRNKTYTFAGATLTVLAFLIFFAIQPTIGTISKIYSEVQAKEVLNQQLSNKIDALTALETQYLGDPGSDNEGYQTVFQDLALIYPAKGNFSFIMASMESLAKRHGFTIQSIGFSRFEQQKITELDEELIVLTPWRVSINIKGNRANFTKFLQSIEKLPNYPEVTSIAFSNQPDSSGALTYTVDIKIYKVEDSEFYTIDKLFGGDVE